MVIRQYVAGSSMSLVVEGLSFHHTWLEADVNRDRCSLKSYGPTDIWTTSIYLLVPNKNSSMCLLQGKLYLRTAHQRIIPQHSLLELPIHLRILRIIKHLPKMPNTWIPNQGRVLPHSRPSSFRIRNLQTFCLPRRPVHPTEADELRLAAVANAYRLLESGNVLHVPAPLAGEIGEQVEHADGTLVGGAEGADEGLEISWWGCLG